MGPIETERQALDLPEVRAIYEAMHASSRRGVGGERMTALLAGALDEADVKLGAYDRRILNWLAGWEPQTVAVIAGWISRAHSAGLSQDDVRTVLDALDVAGDHKRDMAANCPDCQAHPAELCGTCDWRLEQADTYNKLAQRLGAEVER